jgi:two-component system chemotaxis response regulator CheY
MMHRDIKPANLLRDVHGTVKVTDLGLARFSSAKTDVTGITQAGSVLGTVDYMPPEQAVDATQIDHRADIYSLGATLHFLLVGAPPYPETSLMAALLKHRDAPIPSLKKARPEVPAELDAVFRRMMAKAPGDRFQSMSEVIHALKAVQAGLGETADDSLRMAATLVSPVENIETLPMTGPAATAQTIVHETPNVPAAASPKVVLVEPSRTQSAIVRKYLQEKGIDQVRSVSSGKDALAAVAAESPDVIICTLHLPDMTGMQLAQQLRSGTTSVPGFVLISSEAESADAGSLSKYGQGFVLQKPFTPDKLAEALSLVTGSAKPNPVAEHGNLRVLIVDDSAAARMHIRGTLKDLGQTRIVEAADGAQAVAVLAQERFDLIVTDYNMPFMDGRGLVGYIKQNPATSAVPIIMVTTETDAAKLEAVRQLGVTVLDKSFPAAPVRKILEQIAKAP